MNSKSFDILNTSQITDGSPYYDIPREKLLGILQEKYNQGYIHLSTIIGYDSGTDLRLLYPISRVEEYNGQTHFIAINLQYTDTLCPSVVGIFPAADVYEREMKEMLGIDFEGTKYKPLLLPHNFPSEIYPMRKEYQSSDITFEMDKRKVGFDLPPPLIEKERYTIAVGPQHPTHKEPIRFQFYITGEKIDEVELRLGFNHRGIEKALEEGDWIKNLYLIERICGICSAAHQIAYSVAAERLLEIEDKIPQRAQWIRMLIAELERIHSHMLWYGVLAHDAGFDLMFHTSWRDREAIMDILEELTGNRVNYSMMTLGGVRRDIDPALSLKIQRKLKEVRADVEEHIGVMRTETTFQQRLEGIGVLDKQTIMKMNAVGPTARGSGVNFDLRRDIPYLAYSELPLDIHVENSGDVKASLLVRLDETITSLDLCQYILSELPKGETKIRVPSNFPVGEAHARIEAPRGEDIHYLKSTGGKIPNRHKIRAPTLANITSLLYRFRNMQVADIPLIIRLIDPCIGCMERVTFIDSKTLHRKVLTSKELRMISKEKSQKKKSRNIF